MAQAGRSGRHRDAQRRSRRTSRLQPCNRIAECVRGLRSLRQRRKEDVTGSGFGRDRLRRRADATSNATCRGAVPGRTRPKIASGKCGPTTVVAGASSSRSNRSPACGQRRGSRRPRTPIPGWVHCNGQWIASPKMTARSRPDVTRNEQCPGVWPCVGMSDSPGITSTSPSMSSTRIGERSHVVRRRTGLLGMITPIFVFGRTHHVPGAAKVSVSVLCTVVHPT